MNASKVTLALIVSVFVLVAGATAFSYRNAGRAGECPLPNYESYEGNPEDLLILEGRCVVPATIQAISNRNIPKRPFLISFLGNGGYVEALVPLVAMVNDETEPHRSAALIAVFRMDHEQGRKLAEAYKSEQNKLGIHARDIIANEDYLYERKTYWQAWRNYIDANYAF